MKQANLFILTVLAVAYVAEAACSTYAPFYRYWKASGADHFYTTNILEITAAVPGQVGKFGYKSEGVECIIRTTPTTSTVPLYRYWKSSVKDHFYTTNPKEIGTTTPGQKGKHGYVSEGIAGYCHSTQVADTVPLYRYWHASASDHLYTTNSKEIGTVTPGQVGKHGYVSEGITCYVYEHAK